MQMELLRQHAKSTPFRAFVLKLGTGEAVSVRRADGILVPPIGGTIAVHGAAGGFRLIEAKQIAEVRSLGRNSGHGSASQKVTA